jgi:hypothetical protein
MHKNHNDKYMLKIIITLIIIFDNLFEAELQMIISSY